MPDPRVPGSAGDSTVELPCGETIEVGDLNLGMREYQCACGETHGVVMDPHPLSRFLPESAVATLGEAISVAPDDEFEEFGMPHMMGIVMDDYPEDVVAHDASRDGTVGFALVWITDFDSQELHRIVVELMVEIMEHAVSHAEDESAMAAFEEELLAFDVEEFVEEYRALRDFEDEFDEPV